MDTQSLKKQHFWILLVLAVILVPVVLGGAVFGVGSAAKEKMVGIKSLRDKLASASPQGQQFIDAMETQKVELEQRRKRVWELAYTAQSGQDPLVRWPEALKRYEDAYFGDPIPDPDRDKFRNDEVYLGDLYEPLWTIIEPTQFNGSPETKGRSPYNVVRYVYPWPNLPSNEEVWLALEDACVQREVLNDIRSVNQMLAVFLPVPNPADFVPGPDVLPAELEKAKKEQEQKLKAEQAAMTKELKDFFKAKDGTAVGRFLSPYWQLDLAVDRPASGRADELEIRYRLQNVSPRRQNVALIEFKLAMRNPALQRTINDAVVLPVQAEYLAAGAVYPSATTFATATVRGGGREPQLRIYRVEQKLKRIDVPVKRVDRLELGYLSHRLAKYTLVPAAISKQVMDEAPPAADPAATGAPPTGGLPASGGPPGGGSDGRGGGAPDTSRTAHGLPRLRYLDRTDQVRRMPIGLLLIVDQAHVQDVLRAFANSRLRFQDTQFEMRRFHGAIDLTEPDTDLALDPNQQPDPTGGRRGSGGSDMGGAGIGMRGRGVPLGPPGGGRGFPQPGRGTRGGGFGPPAVRGGRGAFSPPGGGQHGAIQTTSDEGTSNLVELSIYGLVSLYERFPPKAPPAGADATGAAPGTAPVGGATPPPASAPGTPLPPGLPVPPPVGPGGGKP